MDFHKLPFPEPFELLPTDQQLVFLRAHRNQLLSESDWTQLPDATVDKEAWAAYRQQLRDITKTYDPATPEVIFPTPPT